MVYKNKMATEDQSSSMTKFQNGLNSQTLSFQYTFLNNLIFIAQMYSNGTVNIKALGRFRWIFS